MRAKRVWWRYRVWRVVAVMCALAVTASACGGTVEITEDSQPDPSQSAAQTEDSQPDLQAVRLLDDPTAMQPSIALANRLMSDLGGEGPAIDALLFAFERGYGSAEITPAIENQTLRADGMIDGVTPPRPELGRIAIDDAASHRVADKPQKRPASNRRQEGKLLVETLRSSVMDHGLAGAETITGLNGVNLILVLLDKGFVPEQIIEIIVLGVFFHESPPGQCYSQQLPLRAHAPVPRPCDETADEAPDAPGNDEPEAAPRAPSDAPESAARYSGPIDNGFAESNLDVVISVEGQVTGTLTMVEELSNYVASIDFGCGLFDEDEDCSDAVVECPATVDWSADMSTLTFSGDAPDNGTLSGNIVVTFLTTPAGCGDPVTETDTFPIAATVGPNEAQVTSPLVFTVPRVE